MIPWTFKNRIHFLSQNKNIIIDAWVPLKPYGVGAKNDKITVSSLNSAYSYQDSHDAHWVSSLSNSPVAVFAFEELQPILEEEVSASRVCWLMCLFTARPRISHKCSMHDKSGDIWGYSSCWTAFSCKKLSTILARWGLAPIVVLKDGILAHLTEIWYNMRSANFVNVPSAIQVPRHNDKGSSSI